VTSSDLDLPTSHSIPSNQIFIFAPGVINNTIHYHSPVTSYHRDITTDDVTVEDDDVTVEDDDVKVYMTRRLQSTYQSDFQSEHNLNFSNSSTFFPSVQRTLLEYETGKVNWNRRFQK